MRTIREKLGMNQRRVTSSASTLEDSGADSLDMVELILELEEESGVKIPDEDAQGLKTVDDVIDYFAKRRL